MSTPKRTPATRRKRPAGNTPSPELTKALDDIASQRGSDPVYSNVTPPSLVLVTNHDDWEGLYVNGVLYTQGHRIDHDDLLRAVGIELKTVEPDGEWLYGRGNLPDRLDEVMRAG